MAVPKGTFLIKTNPIIKATTPATPLNINTGLLFPQGLIFKSLSWKIEITSDITHLKKTSWNSLYDSKYLIIEFTIANATVDITIKKTVFQFIV